MSIRSFGDELTSWVYQQQQVDGVPSGVCRRAMVWMDLLDEAKDLLDLSAPGLALRREPLGGWSIRVDGRWRLFFEWRGGLVDHVTLQEVA